MKNIQTLLSRGFLRRLLRLPDVPYLSALAVVFFILVFTNAPHLNQWLTGWDNLHPEFNFSLNVSRALTAIWQEFQGLGLVGGHGYAATLPHTLFLWFLSIFIPINMLRTFFVFLMLITGSMGAYFLTKMTLRKIIKTEYESPSLYMSSLCAGLFAMLSIGTMQNFTIPLEAFIVHFGILPWLILSFFNVLEERSKRSIFWFILANIAIIPAGFIPPLFVVELLMLSIISLVWLIKHQTIRTIKTILVSAVIVVSLNAYWFLPVFYYTITGSKDYLQAYNNLQSTEDFILRNEKYGTLSNVALLKGFLFEAKDVDTKGNTFSILTPWAIHLNNPLIVIFGYTSFGIALLGAWFLLKKTRQRESYSLVLLFIFFIVLLSTGTPPFSWITQVLQRASPIFNQAFRIPFTKFSLAYGLFLSILVGVGLYTLFYRNKKTRTHYIVPLVFLIGLLYYAFPAFKGNFLYKRTHTEIPSSYFELFSYLKTQPSDGRIVNLPQGWNWGWTPYQWGYSGSGFLWYGIEQPIMDRAFDVWSKYNEQYYWEVIQALFSKNYSAFENLLDKYNITWILFDPSIIPYQNPKYFYPVADIKDYLSYSSKINLVKTFGLLQLYKIQSQSQKSNSVYIAKTPINIVPKYQWNDIDTAYRDYGEYISDESKESDVLYPFRTLFTKRSYVEKEFTIQKEKEGYVITNPLPSTRDHYTLEADDISIKEAYVPVKIYLQKKSKTEIDISIDISSNPFMPVTVQTNIKTIHRIVRIASSTRLITLYLNGENVMTFDLREDKEKNIVTLASINISNTVDVSTGSGNEGNTFIFTVPNIHDKPILTTGTPVLQVYIPYMKGLGSYDSDGDPNFFRHTSNTCDTLLDIEQLNGTDNDGTWLYFSSRTDTQQCFDIILPKLPQNTGYILEAVSKHIEGKALQIAVINGQTKKTDLDVMLPKSSKKQSSYFILPPMQTDGFGYSIKFINTSLNNKPTINYLQQVRLTPLPYNWITSLKLTNNTSMAIPFDPQPQGLSLSAKVDHPNPAYYKMVYSQKSPARIATQSVAGGKVQSENATLILNQAYNDGWKAYEVECQSSNVKCQMGTLLPFLFGKELKGHVLVNNWANAWRLGSQESGVQSTKCSIIVAYSDTSDCVLLTVYLFFLPQLLEWFGFVLLPIPFLFLLWKKKES